MRRIVLSLAVLLMVCFVVADSAWARRGRRGDCCCYSGCGYYSSCWDCGWGSCGYSGCNYGCGQTCYSACGTDCCDHVVGCCQPNAPQQQRQMKPRPEAPPAPSR
ncbi:MAG: hypothetical protein LLG00_00075 [Planctomycetaceae bacterium]|nr:hypothetical protein [Planctomycetaceae bacterium]